MDFKTRYFILWDKGHDRAHDEFIVFMLFDNPDEFPDYCAEVFNVLFVKENPDSTFTVDRKFYYKKDCIDKMRFVWRSHLARTKVNQFQSILTNPNFRSMLETTKIRVLNHMQYEAEMKGDAELAHAVQEYMSEKHDMVVI